MIQKVCLDELCISKSSNLAQKDILENVGEYPVYGASGFISNVNFFHQESEYIAVVKDGAGIGRTMLLPAKSSIIGTMQYLIPKNSVDSKYLYYAVKSMNLSKYFSGATIPHIYFKDYKKELVPLYSRDKQKLISSSLEKLEDIVAKKQQQLSEYDQLIKSRFVEMFGQCDLNKRQNNWFKLGDVTEIVTGTTPSTHIEENWNGKHLWITPAEIKDDSFYIYDTERKLSDIGLSSKSLRVMPINTVLLSTRAPIGKTAIVGKPMTCNQGFKNFICKDKLNPIFLYILLKFNTDYLNSIGSGTTFKEISKTVVSNIEIPVPPIELQNEFASFVKQVDKLKFEVQKSLDESQTLFDSLMQEYFG
jgi:type I restriction enzyme S subunit